MVEERVRPERIIPAYAGRTEFRSGPPPAPALNEGPVHIEPETAPNSTAY